MRRKQPCTGGEDCGDQERGGGLEADDAAQCREGGSGEAEQAEGSFPFDESAGDADGQRAAGDGQAGEDHDVRQPSITVEFGDVAGAYLGDGLRRPRRGVGAFECCAGALDGGVRSGGADDESVDGQRYPSPEEEPYIFYPLRVMLAVSGPEERAVAVLHDVLEDTSVTVGEIGATGVSEDVVQAVLALTHQPGASIAAPA
jgi:hypothetical protein